ncbi:MAG TPA: YybS family protein [Thermoanaerobacterales bacterium]|nr:YybS family protein [Thermoanaerobacterales bacterium]
MTQEYSKTRSMVEGSLLSAITVLLSIASIYLPLIGTIATFVWPVPIIILMLRHGMRTSIMAVIVSGLIVSLLSTPIEAITIILGFGLTGIVLGYAIKNNFSPGKCLVLGAIASVISKVFIIGISMLLLKINPISLQMDILLESLEGATELYSSLGIDPENFEVLLDSFKELVKILPIIIPSVLLLASIMDAFLNFNVARLVLNKLGHTVKPLPLFIYWRLPAFTVPAFLAGIVMTLLYNSYPSGILKFVAMNLTIFFPYLFMIQGLSLLAFFLDKMQLNKILRAAIVFFVIFNPFFSRLLVFAGLLEILFNFRKLKDNG